MKRILLSTTLLFITIIGFAQEFDISVPTQVHKYNLKLSQINIEAGSLMSTYQDARFSDVKYNGFGPSVLASYIHAGKYIWGTELSYAHIKSKGKTHNMEASTNQGTFNAFFLFPISQNEKQSFYLGPKIDFVNMYLRTDLHLSNNASNIVTGNFLATDFLYGRNLNDSWNMEAGLSFTLLSYLYSGISFGYAAPQQQLDEGTYNYNGIDAPQYVTPFWDYLDVEINFRFHYKKRWSFGYKWSMQQQYSTPDMPFTKGYSSLYAAFKIMNKTK